MRVKQQVVGINELLRDIRRAMVAGEEVAATAVEAVAEGTADVARSRINAGASASSPGAYPKTKTGRLERSISVVMTRAKRITAIVGTAQLHGRFLELGTGKMEPRPWLLPSFEAAQDSKTADLRAEFEGRL